MYSSSMQSRITQPRSAWAWLSFVVALALTGPLIWRAWTIVGPSTYQGGDGKSWQSLIREVIKFAPVFHVNILNPLQGMAGFGSPINVWVDPVYWPFFSDDLLFATQASTLIAYVATATAIFVLSRIWRVPLGASIAGSLSSFIIFPAFSVIFGFGQLLTIVPDAAMGAAMMIIGAGISYWVNDLRWRTIISGAILIALWLGYIIYSNPSWFVGAGFVFAPLIAFCILDASSAKVMAARIAAFAIAFALLYAVGPLDYIRTLFAYSSRLYFHSEWHRPQDALYASWVFESPRLLWTYLFFLSGWMVGLIFGDRSERKADFVCLLLFAVFLVGASVYLFAPIHWPATLPVYYEVLVGPIYAFGSIVGYSSFVATVWRKLIAEPASTATGTPLLSSGEAAQRAALFKTVIRAVPVLSGIAFIPVLGAWYVKDEIYAHKYTPYLINTLTEPWPATDELVAYLGDNIGLRNTSLFRGMILINSGFTYETFLVLASLWGKFVPSLNAYSTFFSPRLHYFISHLPLREGGAVRSSSDTIRLSRAWWTFNHLDASSNKLVQALGVRYVFQALVEGDETPCSPDDAALRRQLEPAQARVKRDEARCPTDDASRQFGPTTEGGRKVTHIVYEYNDPNVGNYSPTNVVIARDAPSILQHLWRAPFDLRQSIILPERIEESLVQATSGKMFFERGAIRVQAESRGHSLLLLPVEYSHCLVPSEAVNAKLLPANLFQTAVLFQGSIDLRIQFEYGLFHPGCREQDLAELAELGILDEKDAGPPWAQLHPYAISTIADLPRALEELVKKLAIIAKLSPPPPQIVTICDGYICIGGPDSAPYGTGGTVSWGIPGDAQGCAIGSPTSPSTPVSRSGSEPTGPLYEESTFALSCLDPQGGVHHVQLNIVVRGP
jgi:hypothetical protein